MSFEIRVETAIDAPVEVVWEVLTGVEQWREWSTWLRHDSGDVALGARLRLRLTPPGGGGYAFAPEVIVLERPRHFAWVGRTGVRGVFDGEHHFELEPRGSGCVLRNWERYSGLLSPVMKRLPAMQEAPAGFAAMNEEIRARAEAIGRARA